MAGMGYDSERAALICQHRAGADAAISSAIDAHVVAERSRPLTGPGQGRDTARDAAG